MSPERLGERRIKEAFNKISGIIKVFFNHQIISKVQRAWCRMMNFQNQLKISSDTSPYSK